MLKRIIDWFIDGQAPPPEVLDEERGVDWDAWREAADRVEWKDVKNEAKFYLSSVDAAFDGRLHNCDPCSDDFLLNDGPGFYI